MSDSIIENKYFPNNDCNLSKCHSNVKLLIIGSNELNLMDVHWQESSDDNEINFISGTSSPIGNKYGANNLMHWEVIKYASTHNIKQYNFGGLGIPSIDNFKRSFGGNDMEYKQFIWMKPFVKILFGYLMKIKFFLFYIRKVMIRKIWLFLLFYIE